ncbi:hypothetical protein [Simplicispira lacusdiani]|uniref:hypothetical protein n=1 Tax=Simplicispira lacusdiani TaxID=2213010 RepID=UPI000E746A98|nr:hypothetical protein [Simplicispira lacusdiani]
MRILSVLKWGLLLCGAFLAIEAWRTRDAGPKPSLQREQAVHALAQEPVQTPSQAVPFAVGEYELRPVADFSVRARILGRENYRVGREADLSPLDLALGWKRMADPAVYQALNITQGGRWYRYSWKDQPPIPVREIIESSANMHMIPASAAVRRALDRAREGRTIELVGKLVEVRHPSGWRWNSSQSRSDSGAGACELVYVESAVVE